MYVGQVLQQPVTLHGEPKPDPATVGLVADPLDQTQGVHPVDELAGGVRLDEQLVRDLTDRRARLPGLTTDGQQQLVLGVGEPVGVSRVTAPLVEAPERGPELEQTPVLVIGGHGYTVICRRTSHPFEGAT